MQTESFHVVAIVTVVINFSLECLVVISHLLLSHNHI